MTQFVYGGLNTVFAMGVSMMGEAATPFIGFVPCDPTMIDNSLMEGVIDTTATISDIEAKGGVVIWVDNPDAAERICNHLNELFNEASHGQWGDKYEVTAKC